MRLDKQFKNHKLESKRLRELRLRGLDELARAKKRAERRAKRGVVGAVLADVPEKLRADAVPVLEAAARGKLLRDAKTWLGPLVAVAEQRRAWVRDPADWRPATHNRGRQFDALLRHLLARYDVPAWLGRGFVDGGPRERAWFVHVGAGGNLRTSPRMAATLTKRQAHLAMTILDAEARGLRAGQVVRWALASDAGCGRAVARAAAVSGPIASDAADADAASFWASVLRWFAAAGPMFDPAQVGPVADFLHARRFAPAQRLWDPAAGRWRETPPARPNLSMRGRTVGSVLRDVRAWHAELRRVRWGRQTPLHLAWPPSGVSGGSWTEGTKRPVRVAVTELLDSAALRAEGAAMHHCVWSYAHSCHTRRAAIFSLSVAGERRLTVNVCPTTRRIVEARGRCNAMPDRDEARLLARWAVSAGVDVAGWTG